MPRIRDPARPAEAVTAPASGGSSSVRTVRCADGYEWKVSQVTRASLYRIELVFELAGDSSVMLRGVAPARALADLSDRELCFIVGNLHDG